MYTVANNTYSPNMPDGKKGSETPLSNGLLLYQPFDSVQQTFSASASQVGEVVMWSTNTNLYSSYWKNEKKHTKCRDEKNINIVR